MSNLDSNASPNTADDPKGFFVGIVSGFLTGKNALLLLLLSLALGAAAVFGTPREEEPQIVVPLADVFVSAPGYSADEIERLVATPMERLLWQLDGVEYVYSSSMRDQAVITVRFYVGQDREDSLVKLQTRIQQNMDRVPPMVKNWVIKPIEIDDVPIIMLALYGEGYDEYALRRIAEEMQSRLDLLPELSGTELAGGTPRRVRVEIDRERLQGRGLSLGQVVLAIQHADTSTRVGDFDENDTNISVSVGDGFRSVGQLENLVLAAPEGRVVRLRDVAEVIDGPAEPENYTRILMGAADENAGKSFASITLAVSKQKGTDATAVAAAVLDEAARLQNEIMPDGVEMRITRNYGATADEKVNDLLMSIAFALLTVVILLLVFLGWREALVVALAVPVSFALALAVNWFSGYTINRVTLFALILSLGLVVDDPITNVDNIQRHLRMRKHRARRAVLNGVREVLPPVIMSTIAIIVSFLPMFFITGMMGPYMEPMAANVPLTVTFSTVAALSVVPWLAWVLLRKKANADFEKAEEARARGEEITNEEVDVTSPFVRKLYRKIIGPWVQSRGRAWAVLGIVLLLFFGSAVLPGLGVVPLKMLPYDNKSELQIMVDLPEGSTLEQTDAVVRDFEDYLLTVPEVIDIESFVGTASPMDFNGMVRHTYLRQSPELADIRMTLLPPDERDMQSHQIALRLRNDLQQIADDNHAVMRLVEVPPGPPVLATVVAEIRAREGATLADMQAGAYELAEIMRDEPGVCEVDVMTPTDRERLHFSLDRTQAALHGVDEAQVAALLQTAVHGAPAATLRVPGERQPLAIEVRLPRVQRTGAQELGTLAVRGSDGSLLPLEELGAFQTVADDPVIMHKNLEPVIYVTAEMAGRAPAEAVLSMQSILGDHPLSAPVEIDWAGEGEWEITIRVFRDLGLAFAAALLLIYILLIVETNSLVLPLLVMLAIPLTTIGIMPGFAGLNTLMAGVIGGYQDAIFFTATAMIGMIALGGIVVRNSLVLMQFIQNALAEGASLRDAIYDSGAVRMRPILLTAATTALGAWPITLDPIFSGLAWSLIFGLVASTLFTLVVVPAVYFLIYERQE